jgi:hypothetical protein
MGVDKIKDSELNGIQTHFVVQGNVLWVVTPCIVALHPENRYSKVLRNVGIVLQHYTTSQSRKTRIFTQISHI